MATEKLTTKISKIIKLHTDTNWTKKKLLVLIGLAIAGLAISFNFLGKNTDGVESIDVKSQLYQEKIVAVGQLQLARETTIVAEVSGEVMTVAAAEGDQVSSGSILIFINDTDQDYQLEQKKANYENADAQYRHLVDYDYASAKEKLSGLTSKKNEAQQSFNAAAQLYQEGAASETSYLQAKADYESALADWNTAKLNVEALNEDGSLRSASYAQLQSAKASFESAQNDQKKYHIAVPWDSVLLKAYVEEHDYVRQGDPLADIGEAGRYQVITDLDEKYFPFLKKGMKAAVSVGDLVSGNSTEGTIERITPKINSDTGTFSVTIGLPQEFPYQASDLTVNIEIIMKEKENAIVIPEGYLTDQGNAVFRYENGKAVKTPVTVEKGTTSQVLVLDGLNEGDLLIQPGASVKDGEAVKLSKGEGTT